jgi:plastocyanin
MDQQHDQGAHGAEGGHGGHDGPQPEPSIWSLAAGVSAILLGAVLLWWTRDRGNDFAGPLLGASIVATVFAVFGWLYEDGRLRRRLHALGRSAGPTRCTQVVTLAIAEGQLDAARAAGGVIAELDHSDSALRGLAGFQDLRVIVSPAATGPSQLLVETTWADRERLAPYEETRKTILDVIGRHPEEVVPGSVQVFDMDVVRDTKEVSLKFGLGAIATILGGIVVGGFMVGAGLTVFQEDTGATGGGGAPTTPVSTPLVATDNKFNKSTIEAPPNADFTITWENKGQIPHNLHFYDKKGGKTLADGAGSSDVIVAAGKSQTLTFKTPAASTYYFQCDLHPDQMNGSFVVKEGAGAAAASGGAANASSAAVVATDNKYDKASLNLPANSDVTVSLQNKGLIKHNIHFYDKKGGKTLADGAGKDDTFVDAAKSETLTFKTPAAGKYYYQCDLHPDQMNGTLNVT